MSESYEHCMECDSLTGRAGRAEDSLYHGYIGPFCEDCFEDWPDEQVAQITTLRRRLANSEEKVADAIRCLETVSGKAELGASVVRAERTEVMDHVAEGFDVIKKYAKSEAARLRQQTDELEQPQESE